MFKNATLYRLGSRLGQRNLHGTEFEPCSPNKDKSMGWVPPRGPVHGTLIEAVAGQLILKLMIETKTVPADVIQRELDQRVAAIEADTGRKPGRKGTRELKQHVLEALLPQAFPKRTSVLVWIDEANRLLLIDSASQARCDEVLVVLIKTFDELRILPLHTQTAPAASMASWLTSKESPANFTVDRECELKAVDETKAVVKYGRHPLDIDEVVEHIKQGKVPTRLALTWKDRVSFVLTDTMALKKIDLLEAALIGDKGMTLDNDAFDADVAIATGELALLIPDLITTLGGELKLE